MPHLDSRPPLPVHAVKAANTATGVRLQWRATSADTTSYAIYRRDLTGGDWCPDNDARNLVATQRTTTAAQQTYTDTTATPGHHYLYSVTALDRTWNQSLPIPTIN
jgi:hypothetical protein